jgi:hypothetical protein
MIYSLVFVCRLKARKPVVVGILASVLASINFLFGNVCFHPISLSRLAAHKSSPFTPSSLHFLQRPLLYTISQTLHNVSAMEEDQVQAKSKKEIKIFEATGKRMHLIVLASIQKPKRTREYNRAKRAPLTGSSTKNKHRLAWHQLVLAAAFWRNHFVQMILDPVLSHCKFRSRFQSCQGFQ